MMAVNLWKARQMVLRQRPALFCFKCRNVGNGDNARLSRQKPVHARNLSTAFNRISEPSPTVMHSLFGQRITRKLPGAGLPVYHQGYALRRIEVYAARRNCASRHLRDVSDRSRRTSHTAIYLKGSSPRKHGCGFLHGFHC